MSTKTCNLCGLQHNRKISIFCSKKCMDVYRYNKNKNKIAAKYRQDKESVSEYKKSYYNNNKDKILRRNKEWKSNNMDWVRCYYNNRVLSTEESIKSKLRSRLNIAIKGNYKTGSAVSDLGCSIKDLKLHLESLFYPDPMSGKQMNWDNYGEWHIDHIKPLASFDLTVNSDFLAAVHYTNLQPLWAKDNLRKGAKI